MRVAHFCTSVRGGASTAAQRLHRSLAAGDLVESQFFHRVGPSPGDTYHDTSYDDASLVSSLRHRLHDYRVGSVLRNRPGGHGLFSVPDLPRTTPLPAAAADADVVHLHWIANFLDYATFFNSLPDGQPVVWTLHDMNPFTGGCHYDAGCGRFTDRCGHCPQLAQGVENDLSRSSWRTKRDALATLDPERVRIVGDSRWMAEQARRSSLLGGFDVRTIHYGLDTDAFAPRPMTACREILGLPPDVRVVAFGAETVSDRRKGLPELLDALRALAERDDGPRPHLLTFGQGARPDDVDLPHTTVGHVAEERFLSVVYSAADLFVIPSLQEAFGQTSLEAMACGTPVVGFDTGGIPDTVRPGETGWLAEVGNVDALSRTLTNALRDRDRLRRMGQTCREMVMAEFSLARQRNRYTALYQTLVGT